MLVYFQVYHQLQMIQGLKSMLYQEDQVFIQLDMQVIIAMIMQTINYARGTTEVVTRINF